MSNLISLALSQPAVDPFATGSSGGSVPSSGTYSPGQQYEPQIQAAATEYGVPAGVLYGVLDTESSFNPDAVSQGGKSVGMAQIETQYIPSDEAQGLLPSDFSSTNASQNIVGAASILSSDIKQTGSLDMGIEAYNAGVAGAEQYGDSAYLDRVYANSTPSGQQAIESGVGSSLNQLSDASTSSDLSSALDGLKSSTPVGLTSKTCSYKTCGGTFGFLSDPACYMDNALSWVECQGVNILFIFFGLVIVLMAIYFIVKDPKVFKAYKKTRDTAVDMHQTAQKTVGGMAKIGRKIVGKSKE